MTDWAGIKVFSLLKNNYSTQVNYNWGNVVNSVEKLVNECMKNIKPSVHLVILQVHPLLIFV